MVRFHPKTAPNASADCVRAHTAPESVLVGYDKKSQELFMVQPLEELEDDLELRISLLNRCVCLCLPRPLLTVPQSPNAIPYHQSHGRPRLRLPARRSGPDDVQGSARSREYQGEPCAVARQGRMARRRPRKMEFKYVNVSLAHPTANRTPYPSPKPHPRPTRRRPRQIHRLSLIHI